MSNEDYKKGYRDGYRDGMSDRVTPSKYPEPNVQPMSPKPYITPYKQYESRCPTCGIITSNLTHYVCSNGNCPIFPHVTL